MLALVSSLALDQAHNTSEGALLADSSHYWIIINNYNYRNDSNDATSL